MSNIVQFPGILGASPNQLSGASYASAVESAGLDAALRDVARWTCSHALLGRHSRLIATPAGAARCRSRLVYPFTHQH